MEYCVGKRETVVVGVGGGTASGKTSLVKKLVEEIMSSSRFNNVQILVISMDNYYRDLKGGETPLNYNFDEPEAICINELAETIISFRREEKIYIPDYDFKTHSRTSGKHFIKNCAKSIIIVEGIHALHDSLYNLYDFTIYVDCPSSTRYLRRLHRDITERGRTEELVKHQWDTFAQPTYSKYENTYISKSSIIINSSSPYNLTQILELL